MSLSEVEILTNLKPFRLRLKTGVLQHADCGGEVLHPNNVSLLFSPAGHSQGERVTLSQQQTSTFLHPFAPRALPRFHANMDALTPARLALRTLTSGNEHQPFSRQVSLVHSTRTSMHSVSNHLTRPAIASMLPTQRDRLPDDRSDGFTLSVSRSGLRSFPGGSSLRPAESSSSAYRLHVRLRLLSTPPHGDAVTFGYRERASPGRGLAPLCVHRLPGALGGASSPDRGWKPLLQNGVSGWTQASLPLAVRRLRRLPRQARR